LVNMFNKKRPCAANTEPLYFTQAETARAKRG